MRKTLRDIVNNPWMISVVSGIIVLMITGAFGFLYGIHVFEYLWGMLLFPVPMCIVVILILLAYVFHGKTKDRRRIIPYLEYTEDYYEDVLYKWRYNKNDDGYPVIGEIVPYCSKCNCRIVGRECPVCHALLMAVKGRDEVEALIRYFINANFKIDEFKEIK